MYTRYEIRKYLTLIVEKKYFFCFALDNLEHRFTWYGWALHYRLICSKTKTLLCVCVCVRISPIYISRESLSNVAKQIKINLKHNKTNFWEQGIQLKLYCYWFQCCINVFVFLSFLHRFQCSLLSSSRFSFLFKFKNDDEVSP